MYRVSIVGETDVLDAVRQTAQQAPRRMKTELGKIARGPIAQRMVGELSTEPGPVQYRGRRRDGSPGLRWKSAKQRRYVMMKLRENGTLPYVRTHRLARGWRVGLDSVREGNGLIRVENNDPAVQYVQGDDAQPYHLDTGWPQAAPIIVRYEEQFQDAVIDAWYRVTRL